MDYSSKNTCQIRIPVFYPTMEEFKNFPSYIDYMESQGAHRAGLAKVVPPRGWIPRKGGYDDVNISIPAPIRQEASGNKGMFQQLNIQTKPMTVKEFAKLANSPRYTPPKGDIEELERKFWKNLTFNAPIYGADISGTIYDPDQRVWNVGNLGTILDLVSSAYNTKIEGVNTAYLYFGMWKTSFCWHTEDMDLYSINYLHYGDPKFWYAIPPQNSRRFERLVEGFFPSEAKVCPAFLRHKMTHISPHVLKRYSIPYDTMVQRAGEFMVTFPYAYHSGFNLGYNCAESTNFASRRWIDYGKNCSQCTCSEDTVRIDMDCFVKTYQPSRYDLWKQGSDRAHPEDRGNKKSTIALKNIKDNELEGCSFGTILNNSNLPSKNIKSRRHPIISSEDFNDSFVRSRKRKHVDEDVGDDDGDNYGEDDGEDDDDGDDDEGNEAGRKPLENNKIYTKMKKFPKDDMPCSSKGLKRNPPSKFLISSDDESLTSDVSRNSKHDGRLKKDSNVKNIKIQKRISSFKVQNDIEAFMDKIHCSVPDLSGTARLFINLPFDLNVEMEFHDSVGRVQPHCDVCSLFMNKGKTCPEPPKSSRPLLHPTYVRTSFNRRSGDDDDVDLRGVTDLLKCIVCNLLVHAECYGASYQDPSNWVCDRCSLGDFIDSHCCLCKLRGGALKRTTCSRWVHLTCALVSCQVVVLEGDTKRLIDISRVTNSHAGKKCSKCSPLVETSEGDFLMRCSWKDCHQHFHVSCAHRSKCPLAQAKLNSGMVRVTVTCPQHKSLHPSNGDIVVAKHKNHRYYRGVLKNVYNQIFCSVEFDDGSFSNDTFPEDIQNIKVTSEEHPPCGTPVLIKWSDGEVYNGTFKGINKTPMYQVEFEDSSILNLERKHVWPDNDDLPRRIVSRLSKITDTKGDALELFEVPETLEKRTRGVNLKPIRDDNFV